MVLTSISEFLTISFITPFLSVLSNPTINSQTPNNSYLINLLKISNVRDLQLILALIFLLFAVFSGIIKILNIRNYIFFSHSVGVDLSSLAFFKLLKQDYSYHVNRNSSGAIAALSNFTDKTVSYTQSVLQISTAVLTSLGTIIALFLINFRFTLILIIFFSIIYSFLNLYTKKRISIYSKKIASITSIQIKIMQETISSIRDIIIGQHQNYFANLYKIREKEKRRSYSESAFLSSFPKTGIETLGIILIISITLISILYGKNELKNMTTALPFIGALALGCQRLLPYVQLGYASLSYLREDRASVTELINIANYSNFKSSLKKLKFNKSINFKNVSFKYENNFPYIIKECNIEINKGENIAIIGETGSGKSTLLDLILGLINPSKGEILIDQIPLQSDREHKFLDISHVPQVINLSDSSIIENIAFGLAEDDIDIDLVKKCAKLALIDGFIEKLTRKYNHIIGEKGSKISGGQRQRIGIARALYKKSDILILDEATNALDKITERKVLESIQENCKNTTIIMVTHRSASLDFFDKVFKVQDGKIIN